MTGLAPPGRLGGTETDEPSGGGSPGRIEGLSDPAVPDLVAAIMAEPARPPGTVCGVIRIERENPALGAEIRKALALSADSGRVSRAFQAAGITLSEQVIAKHLRGACPSCQRLTS